MSEYTTRVSRWPQPTLELDARDALRLCNRKCRVDDAAEGCNQLILRCGARNVGRVPLQCRFELHDFEALALHARSDALARASQDATYRQAWLRTHN